jgi:hypothetical protein
MFMLSFLEIPVGVGKRLDFYRSRFCWESDDKKKKYRMSKWDIICRPKDQDGLGIEVLALKNRCLLSKWLVKLLTEEEVWQELLHNKYIWDKTLYQVEDKPTDSPFWKGLKQRLFQGWVRAFGANLGGYLAWGEVSSHSILISIQYCCSVHLVLSQLPLNVGFRRNFDGAKWDAWMQFVQQIDENIVKR